MDAMLDDLPTPVGMLADAAAKLATLAAELGHADLAHAIRDDAKRRLDDGRVRVVVLGEIKHGKSTLINALLGEALLPVGVTPTTGAVVAIRVDADQGQTGTFLVNAAGERSELERERFELLAKGKDHDEAGRTPELLVDADRLPATLELIDTPGFNDIDRFRAAVSRSELPRADVLVLVLDATQVLSRSELGLIRDAIAAVGGVSKSPRSPADAGPSRGGLSKGPRSPADAGPSRGGVSKGPRSPADAGPSRGGLGDSGARCLLVINRIDLVPEDERARIVEHMQQNLVTVIPGLLEPFLTDAKTALRQPDADSEPVAAVARLREELWGLAGRGREILPARARAAMLRHAKLLGYNAVVQARALRLAHDEIATEIQAVEHAMANQATDLHAARKLIADADAKIIDASHERLHSFRAELEEAARAQIHSADIHTLTQVLPGAIQDAFLEFVAHESECLRNELEQLTRELLATYGDLAHRRLSEATLPLLFSGPGIYVEPPKVLIEVAMVTLGLVGTLIWYLGNTVTGMMMTIASPLTTVILREKTVRDAREQARAVLPGALDQAITAMREIVDEVVARHGTALDEHLTLADRAISEQLLDALRRAEQRVLAHEQKIATLSKSAQIDETETMPDVPAGAGEDAVTIVEPPSEQGSEQAAEPELAAKRLRERITAAAIAEFGELEQRLGRLTAELEALELDEVTAPEAPILH